ncbi:non-ribosomal peptide synthetase [Winogradskya humida]|uniref:Pyoverdine biosynthesis protein PvdJ n=1 Tax=Winogradskya humida TaxID=113566 RepID=A0ABQ4A471_9ACTN|nr:non-ribosomal peptide synthetase [Actinoplanes humidus]GIE25645.1 pyoverdine biosynthesis protein PvdJ [Actinoplanes humidus]
MRHTETVEYAPSFAQRRLWFLDDLEGGSSTSYVATPMWRIHGSLDRTRFERAFATLAGRHDSLRTTFTARDGAPVAVIAGESGVPIEWRDADSAAMVAREAQAVAQQPFDLATGPLLRVIVWRMSETEHVLLTATHHIVSDGWSMGVMIRELGTLYDDGTPPDLPMTYADFATWQRDEVDGDPAEAGYWRDRLAGLGPLDLPVDHPRPEQPSVAGATCEFTIDAELTAGLRELGQEHGATLYMTLLAAYEMLLARWSGAPDFGIGTPVAGRSRPEVENLIGFFVNTLVLRTDLAGDPDFAGLLDAVRDNTLDALDHQDVPYERVVHELRPDRHDAGAPLVHAWFAMQNVPGGAEHGSLRFTDFEADRPKALFDVSLFVEPRADDLAATVVYRSDLFDRTTIEWLVSRFRDLLAAVVTDPSTRLGTLELPAAELALVRGFGAGDTATPGDLVTAVERQARRTPDAVAVIAGDTTLSYAGLDARADRVASWLRAHGAGAETIVGVRFPRGADMIVAVLGVLKAGAAYLPVDPAWPGERVDFVIADAGVSLMLQGTLPEKDAEPVVTPVADPEQLAYVIYTSGSTGRPKGVGISRGSIGAHVQRIRRRYALGRTDRVLQFAALAFDQSAEQIFPALTCGATLVLPEHGLVAPPVLRALLDRHGVTVANLPPAYFGELLGALEDTSWTPGPLRLMILGGEAVRPADLARWSGLAPDVELLNAYGPTETTVTATLHEIPAGAGPVVPIGRAIGDRRLHVLDGDLRPVPAGSVGELFIGGGHLARGYLGRPALTADRFVPDPLTPGSRLYATGDLVRWRGDGTLEFRGRRDGQVKVRGFRVELGEVETRLREHPGVRDAAVILWRDRLVAYLAGSGPDRDWLAGRLPEYLIPAVFVPMDELPRTVGGKLDPARLPDPDGHRPEPATGFVAPRDATEQAFARVWCEVLQLDRVGVHDNFFDLGGHSLLVTIAAARLTKALNRPVDVRGFFEHPTIAELAAALPADAPASRTTIDRLVRTGDFPLSFAQDRMWFLNRMDPESPDYMAALAWRVDGPLDKARLDRALRRLADRHESLRTTFPVMESRPVQRVSATSEITSDWREADDRDDAARRAAQELHVPFDLSRGPLFRALVWRAGDDDHLLVLAMHHIVSDGWSMGVLVRDLGALYDGDTLADLPVQYADYAGWQRREAGADSGLDYWRDRLADLPALRLPIDRPRPEQPSWSGDTCGFTLDPELVTGLERLGREHGATLYMTLLAAFQAVLGRWSGQDDFAVGVPVAGRTRPEVENVVGFFVNTLVMRAGLGGDPSFGELLTRVRDHALDAYAHQDVPFERVVEELRPEREPGRTPLFDVLFDLEVRSVGAPRLGAARLRPAEIPFDVTKFDLMVTFTTDPGAAGGFVQFRTDLFDPTTVRALIERCRRTLTDVVRDPSVRLSQLDLPAGENDLLSNYGAGEDSATANDVVEAFTRQAALTPESVAVRSGNLTVSYADLAARSDGVAVWLQKQGMRNESTVGVRFPRGIDMVIAVLGVLKAGAAYVPIDPSWPAERVDLVTADAGLTLTLQDTLPSSQGFLREGSDPEQLAYVIYTSGSTGRPKGVGVSRGAMSAHAERMRRRFALTAADRVLQFAALAFDASVEQIFPVLTCGGSLVLPGHGLIDPAELVADVDRHGVTVMELVPAYLTELLADSTARDLSTLRLLVLGGDAVRPADLTRWNELHPGAAVVNTYGPTEATISATAYDVPAGVSGPVVPIGRALGDRDLKVLDQNLRPVPVGTVGELFIGGSLLARGYLGAPGLTADRFLPDPAEPGARMYRSGDLVRWNTAGQLEFRGRRDDQVKIRGFRVEPDEVEARLREHPDVRDVAVLAEQDRLVAYVAGRAPAREWLAERLPAYLVPAVTILVDELPRTVGGKLDPARLPSPDGHRADLAAYEPPRTPAEETVAAVWREVLRTDRIGVHDNFFDLGGHSLLATRVTVRLRAAFGCDVGLRTLFERPTVARLAAAVEEELVREIAAMTDEDVARAMGGQA